MQYLIVRARKRLIVEKAKLKKQYYKQLKRENMLEDAPTQPRQENISSSPATKPEYKGKRQV